MSLQFNLEQISELIKRDYRVPRFAEFTINSDPELLRSPEHISMKDLLLPLLKDYEIKCKRERYLIDVAIHLAQYSGQFYWQDNPTKQKFMNELADAIPDVKWPVFYPPDVKPNPTKGGE